MEAAGEIAGYRIEAEISQSSTTSVYRAFDPALGRTVLIKKLHPQVARETEVRERFEREARVCAQLAHDNIVAVYGFRSDPELTMLIMEYVEGCSLRDLIQHHGRLEWQQTLTLLAYLLKGVAYAHNKGVLHRDIKPDNILISRQGQVKLTDFGLAVLEDAPKLTRQGAVVGTPAYMPPEQISGDEIDRRSDLFSIGVTIYETLTGVSPFAAPSFSETMHLILSAEVHRPSALVREIPAELDPLIMRLLEKRPARRYAGAEQVLEDIKKISAARGVALESDSLSSLVVSEGSQPPSLRTTTSSTAIRRRQRLPKSAILGGATLALIAIILILFTRHSPAPRELSPVAPQPIAGADSTLPVPATPEQPNPPQDKIRVTARPPSVGQEQTHVMALAAPAESAQASPSPVQQSGATPSAPLANGTLTITSSPWAIVTIDNVAQGSTPISQPISLSPGEHQLILTNDQFPTPVSETITVKPGESQQTHIDLWQRFAVMRVLSVKPWAEIFVDGESFGQTPLSRPLILPFGEHTVELRNPDCQTWRQTVQLTPPNRTLDISVELAPLNGVAKNGR